MSWSIISTASKAFLLYVTVGVNNGFDDASLSEGAGFWHMEASFHVGDFKLSVRDWFVNEKYEHSVMNARYHYAE